MSENVLLVFPPDEMEAMLGEGKALVQKYEPLGLLYIAAAVREKGHCVSIIDAHAESLDCGRIKSRIEALRPDVVGFSVLTCNGAAAYELGRWIKQALPGTLVVFGNVHASVYARPYLENECCDVVVHGDGEHPFLRLVESARDRRAWAQIPGISYRGPSGEVVCASPEPYLVSDLSVLPRPARDLVDRGHYHLDAISNQLYVGKDGERAMTLSTSRGCGQRCRFCVVNQRPRFNPADRVVDELESLEKEHGAAYALFIDPSCMSNQARMFAVCEEIRRRRLSIRWGCDARVGCVTPELVRAMEAANCFDLSFGAESGVQRLLDNVEKGITLSQIARSIAMVKEHSGIRVAGLFMLGLPGETPQDSLETMRFARSLPLDMAQFSLCTPYPGSALFAELRARGEIDTGVLPDGRLDTAVWRRYSAYISFTDGMPIWVTPGQTAGGLKELQKRAQREFYLRPAQILKHARRLRPGNIVKALRIARQAFW
ncbi:MAG: radical SAM protein [Elusimicrobiota bacterium]|jgi:magnesium-protoporphyrin IX monomethyl ester (oxidative) cyclase